MNIFGNRSIQDIRMCDMFRE